MRAIILGAALWALAAGPTAAVAPDECEQQRAMFPKDWNDVSKERRLFVCHSHYSGNGRENRPSGGHYCKRICNRGRRYGWLRLKGLFYQQHPVLFRLAVLVPVFAVLGSHQQGKRSSP